MSLTQNQNQAVQIILGRQSVRRFSQREVTEGQLLDLLELANRAPSGFNLQPWQFVIVRDQAVKRLLAHVAMDQQQILEAPATIVLIASPNAWKKDYDRILSRWVDSGGITLAQSKFYRKAVNLMFRTGPVGLAGIAKRLAVPIRRLRRPTPNILTSKQEVRDYVCAQTMFAVATLLLAAKSAGLDSSPIEQFDEYRLKRLLHIPQEFAVPLIVCVGYRLEVEVVPRSYRLPLAERVSLDSFENRMGRRYEAPVILPQK